MADLAAASAAPADARGLGGRLRAAPGLGSLALLAALLLAYAAVLAVGGAWGAVIDPDAPLNLDGAFRFNVVLTLLVSFTFWARLVEAPSVAADLAALAPHVELTPESYAAQVRRAFDGRAVSALGLAAGGAFGGSVVILSEGLSDTGPPGPAWNANDWWTLGAMVALFGLLGVNAASSVRAMGVFRRLGRCARVRLLAPEPLRIFGRRGLRWARFWFLGSALALLLVVNSDQPGVVLAIILGTLAFGAASLILPCVGVHRRLREVKQAELIRVREALERRGAALLEGRRNAEDDPDIPALLAYETRVQAVSEWPFDAPLLLRFALLILIPLGSWVGGAVVEHLVDALLG